MAENEDVNEELVKLIDELVSKAGPTAGQIKLNQDPIKVERLFALGWKPAEKSEKLTLEARVQKLEDTREKILKTLAEHQKRIEVCEVRR